MTGGGTRPPARPTVLIVGQGPPTSGGIPTFVTSLVNDPWLNGRVDIKYLNTSPGTGKSPAAFTAANLKLAALHALRVFRAARRSDVVHLNVAPVPLLPLVRAVTLALAARLGGAAVVMHAHTGRLQSGVDRRAYRVVLRMSRRLFDAFVVVSEAARSAAARAGIDGVLVGNGVRVEEFRTGPKETDPPVVLFVGTVCERKGLIDLRDALTAMRRDGGLPARVVIVGDGEQEGPGSFLRVRQAYADAGLLGDVEFTGARGRPEVAEALASAAIFCLPSHWEGGPLSVLEAMASEAAVVATRVGEVPAMLDEGQAGLLVDPHAPEQLARALTGLLENPGERSRLALAARSRAIDHYAWGAMTRRLLQIYSGVSGRRVSRPERSAGQPGTRRSSGRTDTRATS